MPVVNPTPASTGSWEVLQTVTAPSGAQVNFTGFSSGVYRNFWIVGIFQQSISGQTCSLTLNSDAGASKYKYDGVMCQAAALSAQEAATTSFLLLNKSSATDLTFIDVHITEGLANLPRFILSRSECYDTGGGSGAKNGLTLNGFWNDSSNPITSIQINSNGGANFSSGRLVLYGMRS